MPTVTLDDGTILNGEFIDDEELTEVEQLLKDTDEFLNDCASTEE